MNTASIPVEIPLARIASALTPALDSSSIVYWTRDDARHGRYTPHAPRGFTPPDWKPSWCDDEAAPLYLAPLVRGGWWTLYVDPDDNNGKKSVKLDLAAIRRGLAVLADKYPKRLAEIMAEEGDAETADVFVQCCVFGDVIYG